MKGIHCGGWYIRRRFGNARVVLKGVGLAVGDANKSIGGSRRELHAVIIGFMGALSSYWCDPLSPLVEDVGYNVVDIGSRLGTNTVMESRRVTPVERGYNSADINIVVMIETCLVTDINSAVNPSREIFLTKRFYRSMGQSRSLVGNIFDMAQVYALLIPPETNRYTAGRVLPVNEGTRIIVSISRPPFTVRKHSRVILGTW